MPIRDYNPNIEAIKAEVALLEEQRGILKSPEMIAAMKAEIETLSSQRLKVLADTKKAKKSLDDTVAKQIEQGEVKLKELQTQYASEQERYIGLLKGASAKLIQVTTEVNTQKDAIPEVMATLEEQKKIADEQLVSTAAKVGAKLKELNDRRNAYREEMKSLDEALEQRALRINDSQAEQNELQLALDGRQTALNLQAALLNEARVREQKFNAEQEALLKLEYDKLNIRKDLIADREKAITEREGQVLVQEAGLSNLKTELDLREQKVIQDRQDMVPKWDEILKRESDLETNWKVYSKAKKKLDQKLKEMEG